MSHCGFIIRTYTHRENQLWEKESEMPKAKKNCAKESMKFGAARRKSRNVLRACQMDSVLDAECTTIGNSPKLYLSQKLSCFRVIWLPMPHACSQFSSHLREREIFKIISVNLSLYRKRISAMHTSAMLTLIGLNKTKWNVY